MNFNDLKAKALNKTQMRAIKLSTWLQRMDIGAVTVVVQVAIADNNSLPFE